MVMKLCVKVWKCKNNLALNSRGDENKKNVTLSIFSKKKNKKLFV